MNLTELKELNLKIKNDSESDIEYDDDIYDLIEKIESDLAHKLTEFAIEKKLFELKSVYLHGFNGYSRCDITELIDIVLKHTINHPCGIDYFVNTDDFNQLNKLVNPKTNNSKQMKIYLIEKPSEYREYDCYNGFVIVANSKDETIKIAQLVAGNDQPIELWSYSKITECGVYTGNETEPFILLSDYLRG